MCAIRFDQYQEQFKRMTDTYPGLGYSRVPILTCISNTHVPHTYHTATDIWKHSFTDYTDSYKPASEAVRKQAKCAANKARNAISAKSSANIM